VRPFDWIVLCAWLVCIVSYGLWRGRASKTIDSYLRAGNTMPWYAMGLSIMATQAGAISFISTTGQAYTDGMRFVQFYFGLPIAMVIIAATAAPIFHRARVYTAYEYLERRFDAKTRCLVSIVFLIERGLAAGVALYAPAVVLSVVLGWPDRLTTLIMGSLMVFYTAMGGIKAVTWADVQQMAVLVVALILALGVAIHLLPPEVSVRDALTVAGAAGRLNTVDLHFDWNSRYNLWSGLIGGLFLALAYFGTDQSQVQRYLTGKSIGQSRLSLMFMALTKIPMQLFILFIGAMVFVLFTFVEPPVLFHPAALAVAEKSAEFAPIEQAYHSAFESRRTAAAGLIAAERAGFADSRWKAAQDYRQAERRFEATRSDALKFAGAQSGTAGFNDTNYIFLSFVTRYLPVGVVGLVIGVIFSAGMSSISGEINSLATVSVIDIYRRYFARKASDRHYLIASRLATVFWGAYAIAFASRGSGFGALIETVNMVGSLFYGSMLGVFVLAFGLKRVGGTGAFTGVLAGETVVILFALFSGISYLWYNLIGCLVTVAMGLAVSLAGRRTAAIQ
jgi:SSS family transporter